MPRLLIVDDEQAIRSLLSVAFARAGYEVRTASDSFQAMDLLASEAFDAILSDVQMPKMDGHSLIRWVAETHPGVRSVLMSGYDIQCGDCPLAGRCELLQKPFGPALAVMQVGRALQQPRNPATPVSGV